MNKQLLLTATLILLTAWVKAQPYNYHEKMAVVNYHSKDFQSALEHCHQLIEGDFPPPLIYFIAGESARQLRKYDLAEKYYLKVPDKAKIGQIAVTDFRLATVKKIRGEYIEAINYFERYREKQGAANNALAYQALQEIEFCQWAMVKGNYPLYGTIERLPGNINSEYSDLAPLRYADKIYFTSVRPDSQRVVPFAQVFTAIEDYPAIVFKENMLKSYPHVAHVSLMPDASRMYFTLCADRYFQQEAACEIWYMDKLENSEWGKPQRLPEEINLDGYTATQPSVGYDRFLGKYVLYFVSDRPGGVGKKDIWCSTIEADGCFNPPALLPFNTPEDDCTPYFHMPSQSLFFSSNGLQGLGGFDIYRIAKYAAGSWPVPVNLGEGINSEYDDLYFTYHHHSQKGYFSSNRPGTSMCKNHSPGCFCCDIYEANIFVDLQLRFQNTYDSTAVKNAFVEVREAETGKSEIFSTAGTDNNMLIPLLTGRKYQVIALAEGFLPSYSEVNTSNVIYHSPLQQDFFLFEDGTFWLGNKNQTEKNIHISESASNDLAEEMPVKFRQVALPRSKSFGTSNQLLARAASYKF